MTLPKITFILIAWKQREKKFSLPLMNDVVSETRNIEKVKRERKSKLITTFFMIKHRRIGKKVSLFHFRFHFHILLKTVKAKIFALNSRDK